jgi:acyl carrier protein
MNAGPPGSSLRDTVVRVLTEVAPDVDTATLQDNVLLRDQFEFDSMDVLNFAIGLKRNLGVDIPDADFRALSSIDRCLAYLATRNVARPA